MLNSLDPDLGPNCLQRLSEDDIGKQKVKVGLTFGCDLFGMVLKGLSNCLQCLIFFAQLVKTLEMSYEPCHEKTCILGFRPGPTQTRV